MDCEGQIVRTTCRDSEPGSYASKGTVVSNHTFAAADVQIGPSNVGVQTHEPSSSSRGPYRGSQTGRIVQAQSEAAFNTWWRSSRDARIVTAPPPGQAAQRLEALRLRVLARR